MKLPEGGQSLTRGNKRGCFWVAKRFFHNFSGRKNSEKKRIFLNFSRIFREQKHWINSGISRLFSRKFPEFFWKFSGNSRFLPEIFQIFFWKKGGFCGQSFEFLGAEKESPGEGTKEKEMERRKKRVFCPPQKTRKDGDNFPKIISKKLFFLKLDRSNLHYKTRLKMAPDSQKIISKIGQKLSDR